MSLVSGAELHHIMDGTMGRTRIEWYIILALTFLILAGCQREDKKDARPPGQPEAPNQTSAIGAPPPQADFSKPPMAVMRNDLLHVTSRYGPFPVGTLRVDSVFVDIVTRLFPDSSCNFHKSDVAVTIFDKNRVLFCKNYPAACEDEITFACFPVDVSNLGHLLLLTEEAVPSAPGSGVTGIYYCISSDGFFIPVTGLISPSSNNATQNSFPVVTKRIANDDRTFVECSYWTGNFGVTYDYPLNLQGAWDGPASPFGFETYPVRIDAKWAKDYRDRRASFADTLTLFENLPFKSAKSRRIIVSQAARIEFLDASPASNEWWLHIRIDEHEGYIRGSKDLDVVGLPDAG